MAKKNTKPTADTAMVGLGVMGRNLALNMADHGLTVAAFDVHKASVQRFVAQGIHTPSRLIGCHTLRALVACLKRPRKNYHLGPRRQTRGRGNQTPPPPVRQARYRD